MSRPERSLTARAAGGAPASPVSHRVAKRGRGNDAIGKANTSQGAQGEPESGELPVALRPGCQRRRDCVARQVLDTGFSNLGSSTSAALSAADSIRTASTAASRCDMGPREV